MSRRYPLSQGVRYMCAGAIGVIVYYALLYVLTDCLGCWYLLSAFIGSVVNFGTNFFLQKFVTFKNPDRKSVHKQMAHYALLYFCLTCANLASLFVLTEHLHLWYILSQLPTSILLTLIGYHFSKKIFKE